MQAEVGICHLTESSQAVTDRYRELHGRMQTVRGLEGYQVSVTYLKVVVYGGTKANGFPQRSMNAETSRRASDASQTGSEWSIFLLSYNAHQR
jgi:hypothetical protein